MGFWAWLLMIILSWFYPTQFQNETLHVQTVEHIDQLDVSLEDLNPHTGQLPPPSSYSPRPNTPSMVTHSGGPTHLCRHFAGSPKRTMQCPICKIVHARNFLSAAVVSARAKFGRLTDTKANRLVVRGFLLRLMNDHGMRPTHIAKHIEYCVVAYFIPVLDDIEAAKFDNSNIAQTRRAALFNAQNPSILTSLCMWIAGVPSQGHQ